MQGRRWPWWVWTLVGLASLAGIVLAVWKLPSLLYGDASQASADARLQASTGFRTGITPNRFSIWFRKHVRRLGLPRIRLHDVRHSYATASLAAGVPAKVVSERLGHATIGITMNTYSHVIPGMDATAAAQVAAIIDGEAQ